MGISVLVTGGAGYIGSHVVIQLQEAGYSPIVLDNFSTGRRELVVSGVPLIEANVGDVQAVRRVIREFDCQVAMHFAGSIVAPESVENPIKYYDNNCMGSFALIRACMAEGVDKFVFSSSAAVYGQPKSLPVTEQAPTNPFTPYGRSKLVTEWMLADIAAATSLRYVALRYFNVAGADPLGRTGQCSVESTHLIKTICETITQQRDSITIFGTDYKTADGTAVRDFIHVSDLAAAHVKALEFIVAETDSAIFNCGYGRGYSVKEVLSAAFKVAGEFKVIDGRRRKGDPAEIVADNSKITKVLGLRPQFDDLDEIISTSLRWELSLNKKI